MHSESFLISDGFSPLTPSRIFLVLIDEIMSSASMFVIGASLKVTSFKTIEPDLEEIFLSFYKKGKKNVK